MNRPVIATIVAVILIATIGGCARTPQLGVDKDAFKTVDALYTAVGLKDIKLVEQCEVRLKALRDANRLPDWAYGSLESIIAEARAARWESAQDRLSKFMDAQTR